MSSAPTSTSSWGSRTFRAAALLFLVAAVSVHAQDPSISAAVAGPSAVNADGRQTLTVALLVANSGATDSTLVVNTVLPQGWKVIGDAGPFTLAPGAEDLRLIGILVPAATAAGPYRLSFHVRETEGGVDSSDAELTVTVRAAPHLKLLVVDRPMLVIAGAAYTMKLLIVNSGNADVRPGLSYTENLGLRAEIAFDAGSLAPGDQRAVTITVQTDSRIRTTVLHRLTLTAADLPADTAPADTAALPPLAESVLEMEIVPLGIAGDAPMHSLRLDTETTGAVGFSDTFIGTLKESLSLHGTLDTQGEHAIAAEVVKNLATGADPLVSPEDFYSLAWKHRLGSVTLGDGSFSLSPLLASDVNGRGAQAFFTPPGFRVGGMYYSDPWDPSFVPWLGATAGISLPLPASAASSVYSADAGIRLPVGGGDPVFGLWQTLSPMDGVKLQFDAALHTGISAGVSPAVFAEASAVFDTWNGDIQFLRAWPDFSAQFNDTQKLQAIAATNLFGEALNLSGSFSWSDGNLLQNTSLSNADRTIAAGLQAHGSIPGWGSRPALSLQVIRQRDLLPSPAYDILDILVRASWQQEIRAFSLGAFSAVDRTIDLRGGPSVTALEGKATLDWRENSLLGLSASLGYSGTYADAGSTVQAFTGSVGVRAGWGGSSLEALLHAAVSTSAIGTASLLAGIGGSGTFRLPGGSSIRGTAGFDIAPDSAGLQPLVNLSIAFAASPDLPIYRIPDSAVVRGRVFDQSSGEARPGAVLRLNGLATVSDGNGAYVFNLPQSGTYYLSVDRGSLGFDLIPDRPTPIEVSALPGAVTVVDIGIVQRASLAGSVTTWEYPLGGTYDPSAPSAPATVERTSSGGLANIILELSDGARVMRRVTDRNGGFEFGELLPGSYTLTVSGDIPAYHRLEQTVYQIELAPGQSGRVEVRVLQELRRIQIVPAPLTATVQESP